jgi:hypothetical protein
MLGVLRSRVNEDDTPMDAGKGKSRDFGLSQALANQVVRKAVCGDFILCGLSPPVSPRRSGRQWHLRNPSLESTLFGIVRKAQRLFSP